MIKTSKLALIAVLAAMSVASPAFAQSFNKADGTGNELPFAYGPGGTKPAWTCLLYTSTPAPPMPIQAMPAPMYFAAVGSM